MWDKPFPSSRRRQKKTSWPPLRKGLRAKFLLFLLPILLFSAPSQYGKETLESLSAAGLLKLQGTTISGTLEVQGILFAQEGQIGSLTVSGETHLTNTTIQGSSSLIGFVQAADSTFEGPVTLIGQKGVFSRSTLLSSLTIEQDALYRGKQILELRPGTRIEGTISFSSGKGEVLLWPGAVVLYPIKGAKIIRR